MSDIPVMLWIFRVGAASLSGLLGFVLLALLADIFDSLPGGRPERIAAIAGGVLVAIFGTCVCVGIALTPWLW